ncbi:MAG: hypothetical protein AABZ39_04530 [Spirochaetota bacterium]
MKYSIQLLSALSAFIILGTAGCTPNARPFELLMGLAPLGDVDFLNLPNVTPSSVTVYSNGAGIYDPQIFMNDSGYDLTVTGTNVFVLRKDRCDVVSTNGILLHTVIISNTQMDYFGIESCVGSFYMTGRTATGMKVYFKTNLAASSNINPGDYGWGGSEFYDFQAKYMKINPADGSYWFIRYHQPIQTENPYPESDSPPIQEQIRKYRYAFSVSNLTHSALYDNNMRFLVGLRVPAGQCFGMAFHRGKLYVMYRTPTIDNGTVRWDNGEAKTIFIIDPRTLTYVGKVSQRMSGYANGLASDGVNLYTIGQPFIENFSGYSGTFLVKMNIPN